MNITQEEVQFDTKRKASLSEKLGQKIFFALINKWQRGSIVVTLPDGEVHTIGAKEKFPSVSMTVKRWGFFKKLITGGDIAFGEGYVEGDWESSNLVLLLQLFAENQDVAEDRNVALARMGELFDIVKHKFNANTLTGSRKNISAHYDLSNDLYKLFLDKEMQYSCALWTNPEESLEEAQLNKMHSLLKKLKLKPGMKLLEIGSGWGKLAILAAKEYGVTVKSITLSEKQRELAVEHAAEAGVSDKVEFALQDYRHENGLYDRVLSVEMVEAVGHENLGTYFSSIDKVLKKDGLAVIQAITIPDQKYDTYRKSCDWIQKYIFPGAVCPSLDAMQTAMKNSSSLMVENVENIGISYARTLKEWNIRFQDAWKEIEALGFDDRFKKIWTYYLNYCEAGYRARILGNLHVVMSRTNNPSLGNPSEKSFSRGQVE